MGDDGFDFRAPERKEAKRFEPPPWEVEAFEELQRKRAEEERAAVPEPAGDPAAAETGSVEAQKPPAPVDSGAGAAEAEAGPDEKRVVEMLAGLSAEEPKIHMGAWKVALASAIVLGAIGGVLIIWAMAAFVGSSRTGTTGAIGGVVLLVFGAGFVFGALWLAFRTLRQRGVL